MKSETEKNYFEDRRYLVASPIRLKGSITGSPSRYIPTYNPNRVLPTADKGLATTLEETYRMKDSMTPESVINDLDLMLATFDEKSSIDSESSDRNFEANKKINKPPKIPSKPAKTKNATVEKTPTDEFYYQKSSWTNKRYSLPIQANTNHLETQKTDFRSRVQTDGNNYKKTPSKDTPKFAIQVFSSPTNNSPRTKNNSKFYVDNGKKSSSLEKQSPNRTMNIYDSTPKQMSESKRQFSESKRQFSENKTIDTNFKNSNNDYKTSKNEAKRQSREYKIELFKTTEKKNSIIRTDTASTRSKPTQQSPVTPKTKDCDMENPLNDSKHVYNTVKGFDSFMMY